MRKHRRGPADIHKTMCLREVDDQLPTPRVAPVSPVRCASRRGGVATGRKQQLCVCLPSYCDQLKVSESTQVLQPFLPSVLDGLIHLAAQFSSEVLNLVMEALCIVCTVDPAFTANMESKICPFTIAIFLKYSNGMPPGRVPGRRRGPWPWGCWSSAS